MFAYFNLNVVLCLILLTMYIFLMIDTEDLGLCKYLPVFDVFFLMYFCKIITIELFVELYL